MHRAYQLKKVGAGGPVIKRVVVVQGREKSATLKSLCDPATVETRRFRRQALKKIEPFCLISCRIIFGAIAFSSEAVNGGGSVQK
ncbi:Hypothetical protein NTJ_05785 [Nesidiocoris tenuis]|uniref:Uncharacterized protein n=1 Tax=Nesidiocoris tenuis TaxID=355587 RepID=A0ABN7AL61_9HEMI|nr:Hypothetical protein NTJ_05785 [Nesidiocoris tenuis]